MTISSDFGVQQIANAVALAVISRKVSFLLWSAPYTLHDIPPDLQTNYLRLQTYDANPSDTDEPIKYKYNITTEILAQSPEYVKNICQFAWRHALLNKFYFTISQWKQTQQGKNVGNCSAENVFNRFCYICIKFLLEVQCVFSYLIKIANFKQKSASKWIQIYRAKKYLMGLRNVRSS